MSHLSHRPNVQDLMFMKELIEADEVVPVIARRCARASGLLQQVILTLICREVVGLLWLGRLETLRLMHLVGVEYSSLNLLLIT